MHFFQLKKKRKRTNIHFQTRNLHQKEIKFARTPSKYPFILFPNFPTFILIQTLFSPFENLHPHTTVTLAPFNPSTKNPSQTSNIQLRYRTSRRECQYLILKEARGEDREAGNHTRHAISRGTMAGNTSKRRDASEVMPCHVVDIWIARGSNRSRG